MPTSVTAFGDYGGGTGVDIAKYIASVPVDPLTGKTGSTQSITGVACGITPGVLNSAFIYEYYSDGTNYELRSAIESVDNCSAIQNDGKSDNFYELGTNPGMAW